MDIKKLFPIYKKHPELAYFDTGASSLTPKAVIDAVNEYYKEFPVNIHRGLYNLSATATQKYSNARKEVSKFIGAETNEVIFTSGTTSGINILAGMLTPKVLRGSNIVLTRYEHHANLLPWQRLAQQKGAELRFIELTDTYELDLQSAKELIDQNTAIVAFGSVSNVLGTIAPCKELISLAHNVGALAIMDAAQHMVHQKIDVKTLGCDAMAFSGHKIYGPTGIGVLYATKELLSECEPQVLGGDMIESVSYTNATWAEAPQKFEAGTPNIAGAVGLAAAVRFLEEQKDALRDEKEIMNAITDVVRTYGTIIGPDERAGVTSFIMDGVHPHDIAEICNREGVAIRAGHHCAEPLMKHLTLHGTARISVGLYNNLGDVEKLETALKKVKALFG